MALEISLHFSGDVENGKNECDLFMYIYIYIFI
jgi:hypothetical protein